VRRGVSDVVEPYVAEAGPRADAAPAPADIVRLHWRSDAGGEDEPVLPPVLACGFPLRLLPDLVLAQGRDAQLWQRDGTDRLIRLGRDEPQLSRDPLDRLDHFQGRAFDPVARTRLALLAVRPSALTLARVTGHQVDVFPTQPEQLPATQAEAERQDVERVEPFVFCRVEDGTGLSDGEPAVDLVFGGADLPELRDVARDDLFPYCRLESVPQ
jgi:hypothetical protein